jgi:hypothetical protein
MSITPRAKSRGLFVVASVCGNPVTGTVLALRTRLDLRAGPAKSKEA